MVLYWYPILTLDVVLIIVVIQEGKSTKLLQQVSMMVTMRTIKYLFYMSILCMVYTTLLL